MERLEWNDFLSERFEWRQGEHVTLIGTTGAGKTTLAKAILPMRSYVIAVATKPRDPVVSDFRKEGFIVSKEWPGVITIPERGRPARYVLWPKIDKPEDVAKQKETLTRFFGDVYRTGGWTVYLDELPYVAGFLGLEEWLTLLWLQGRALGISIVSSTQRPRNVPLAAFSQASHLFIWKNRDVYDMRRLAEIGGTTDWRTIADTAARLDKHEVMHLGPDGRATITSVRP